jgi:hypothetical protein
MNFMSYERVSYYREVLLTIVTLQAEPESNGKHKYSFTCLLTET